MSDGRYPTLGFVQGHGDMCFHCTDPKVGMVYVAVFIQTRDGPNYIVDDESTGFQCIGDSVQFGTRDKLLVR